MRGKNISKGSFMNKKLIVIEGLDGSGKKTQSKLLFQYLIKKNVIAKHVSFPDYSNDSSILVKMYLNSELGNTPYEVNEYAASLFFAVDRFVSFKKYWKKNYENNETIIADRYTTSNAIYQMAKIPSSKWDSYLNWLYDFEYKKLNLPIPDLVIYLNMPIKNSQQFLKERYDGDETKKDLHETNVVFLEKCCEAAKYSCLKDNWININCVKNGSVKSIDEIHNEIILFYEKYFE
jgi:dTMP kinase